MGAESVRGSGGQSVCPACQQELGDATGVSAKGDHSARPPRAGDIGLCAYCGQELIFMAPHKVRAMTAEEEARLDDSTRRNFRTVQQALRMMSRPGTKLIEKGHDWD